MENPGSATENWTTLGPKRFGWCSFVATDSSIFSYWLWFGFTIFVNWVHKFDPFWPISLEKEDIFNTCIFCKNSKRTAFQTRVKICSEENPEPGTRETGVEHQGSWLSVTADMKRQLGGLRREGNAGVMDIRFPCTYSSLRQTFSPTDAFQILYLAAIMSKCRGGTVSALDLEFEIIYLSLLLHSLNPARFFVGNFLQKLGLFYFWFG